jgi:hypothetical protein
MVMSIVELLKGKSFPQFPPLLTLRVRGDAWYVLAAERDDSTEPGAEWLLVKRSGFGTISVNAEYAWFVLRVMKAELDAVLDQLPTSSQMDEWEELRERALAPPELN